MFKGSPGRRITPLIKSTCFGLPVKKKEKESSPLTPVSSLLNGFNRRKLTVSPLALGAPTLGSSHEKRVVFFENNGDTNDDYYCVSKSGTSRPVRVLYTFIWTTLKSEFLGHQVIPPSLY